MKIPFIVQIWNKSDPKDDLIGTIKLNLSKISKTVLVSEGDSFKSECNNNNINLLVLYNELITAKDITESKDKLVLEVVMAFGTAK